MRWRLDFLLVLYTIDTPSIMLHTIELSFLNDHDFNSFQG